MTGIGTWAYFADVETSTGNVMSAGTLDLKTDDVDGVTQTLFATDLEPGEAVGSEYITLKNAGSIDSSSLDLSFTYQENDLGGNPVNMSADDTAAQIEVVTLKYDGVSLLGSISDTNSNGYRDIEDLKNADLSGQGGIASQASKSFEIAVRSRNVISGDYQGDGISVTMNFDLNQ